MTTTENTTMCPCCGDDMPAANVVCWTCYRLSNRLQPGTYPQDDDIAFVVTDADVARWDAARSLRLVGAR